MPIYDFQCDDCQKKIEERRKYSELNLPAKCPECHSPAKRIPSRFAIFNTHKNKLNNSESTSSKLLTERDPSAYNGKRPPAVIDMSNCINSGVKDCTFENADRAIYAENAELKIENIELKNVRVGIEHINSKIEGKNIKSKND